MKGYNIQSKSFEIAGVPCRVVEHWNDDLGAIRYHAYINGKKHSIRVNVGLWGNSYADMDSFPSEEAARYEIQKALTK